MPRSTWIASLVGLTALAATTAVVDATVRHPSKPAQHQDVAEDDLGRPPHPDVPGPLRFAGAALEPLAWGDLDGWAEDNHVEALRTFLTSCRAVQWQLRSGNDSRPILPVLADVCTRVLARPPGNARKFFEDNFRPVRIYKLGDSAGFLTGYYEPIVHGSRFPTREFTVPIYRRPSDLVPPAGYQKGQGFPNSGRAMRQLADGTLVPYYDRGEIEDGALDGQHLEICWIKDPIDLLFIQIQGSARVRLEDGTMLRINYDAHNGFPYTAVGRVLIERNEVAREEMSMERIREWMNAHPDQAKELRDQNRSYVFFRIVGLSGEREATGAQGVPLTPRRSIAVDKALHVYGTPFYIQAGLPVSGAGHNGEFHRLMIAQDTGSAIVGPARADIYFGAGDEAGKVAGRLRHPGMFALLIPRALDPTVAGAAMPLPLPRPVVVAKDTTKPPKAVVRNPAPKARPTTKLRAKWWRT
jgi:membrane-bound lytic murein transglycosylase A